MRSNMTNFFGRPWSWMALGSLALTGACGSDGADSPLAPSTTTSSDAGATSSPVVTGGPTTGGATPSTTSVTGGTPDSGTGGAGDVTGDPVAGGRGLPCDVQEVVDAHCTACHSDPPQGTFMPLVTQAHFHAQGTSDMSKKYYELAAERVVAPTNPMPPASESTLNAQELETLTSWFSAGAPLGTEACETIASNQSPLSDDGRDIDTTGLECAKFVAHAPNDKSTKFKVGTATDAYYNMVFQAPWQEKVYGVVVKPIIDNGTVLHHWLLYREPGAGADGTVEDSGGQHGGGELVHGWAPGGMALDFRKYGSVGFELEPTTYVVEFHYNSADANAEDASGVEICFIREEPEHVAGISWLGLDHGVESYVGGAVLGTELSGTCLSPSDQWVGTCAPASQEPIQIMFLVPHMHEAGVNMSAVINGPNGQRTMLDEPFDFAYQKAYETDEVLMPGETITTTCDFSAPKCAGQATGAEMCYLYTYAYPKGALVDNGAWGALAHGEGTCLGQ